MLALGGGRITTGSSERAPGCGGGGSAGDIEDGGKTGEGETGDHGGRGWAEYNAQILRQVIYYTGVSFLGCRIDPALPRFFVSAIMSPVIAVTGASKYDHRHFIEYFLADDSKGNWPRRHPFSPRKIQSQCYRNLTLSFPRALGTQLGRSIDSGMRCVR